MIMRFYYKIYTWNGSGNIFELGSLLGLVAIIDA